MRAIVVVGVLVVGCEHGQTPPFDAKPPPDETIIIVDAMEFDHGFNPPFASLRANVEQSPGDFVEVGAADLSCLGTANTDTATTTAVALSTTVRDFQSDNLVPGALVSAFPGENVGANFAAPVSADGNAKATLNIPSGTTRFGIDLQSTDSLRTIELRHILVPNQASQTLAAVRAFSNSTSQTLPALVGVSRTPGTGLVVATMRDCQDRPISNFIATVSFSPGFPDHVPNANTFYFSPSVGLPVRHSQQEASSGDGLFMVIELFSNSQAFIQVWGFPTDTDLINNNLVEVAELAVPIMADTVLGGDLAPLRF